MSREEVDQLQKRLDDAEKENQRLRETNEQLRSVARRYQHMCHELTHKCEDMESELNRSANAQFLSQATFWEKSYREKVREVADLQGTIIQKDATIRTLQTIVDSYEKLTEPKKGRQAAKNALGQFKSTDGMSKHDKEDVVYRMVQEGKPWPEIATSLGLGIQSAKTYYNNYVGRKVCVYTPDRRGMTYTTCGELDANGSLTRDGKVFYLPEVLDRMAQSDQSEAGAAPVA